MKKIWTASLDEENAKRIRAEFEGSRFLLDRLFVILKSKQGESLGKIRDEKVYEKPLFSEYIADQLGYQRCLRDIINLIKE